jgi:hypothetical protein
MRPCVGPAAMPLVRLHVTLQADREPQPQRLRLDSALRFRLKADATLSASFALLVP